MLATLMENAVGPVWLHMITKQVNHCKVTELVLIDNCCHVVCKNSSISDILLICFRSFYFSSNIRCFFDGP